MNSLAVIFVIASIYGIIFAIRWVFDTLEKASVYAKLKPKLDALDKDEEDLRKRQTEWKERVEKDQAAWEKKIDEDKLAIAALAKEKTIGFPWLASAWADYLRLCDLKISDYLEYKSHPAKKAAEQVREVAAKRRVTEQLWRVLKYKLEYYESLFPWLIDFNGDDLDDLICQLVKKREGQEVESGDEDDPAEHWLTPAEYNELSDAEKYQRALDRYWQKRKTRWEIGRDYERYIGYTYECRGWQVYYQGIVEGLQDLGRDLIATSGSLAEVIQCKHWSQERRIHEKHVFQLYGTLVAYKIDHPGNAHATLITSTTLSDRAKQFANALGVKFRRLSSF